MAETPTNSPQKTIKNGNTFPSTFFSTENCGKRSFNHGFLDFQDGSSLSLGLGSSTNSGITMNLTIEPTLKTEGPKVDLELSLAAGSVESSVIESPFPFLRKFKPPITTSTVTSVQLVDEGSTSSRWKLPLFSWSPNTEPRTDLTIHGGSASFESVWVPPHRPRRNSNVKDCRFTGCTRGARGASGFCIAHGGGRRCQRDGCQKGAEGKTVFCKAHGGGRRCEFLGCTKSAEGRTDFCIGHGGGRRCSHDGCTHAARGKSGLCIRHGGGKRCKIDGCVKSAEGVSGVCISHGGGRRCCYPACTKGAQGSTMFCKAHGGGKRCVFFGCTKGAEGSTRLCKGHGGGKRCTFEGGCSKSVHGGTRFCVSHGGGKRCALAECTKSARGRTSFCVRHGGGKRCKNDGCGKSAQGRTDFCKAHGGGKRCSWVPPEPCVGQSLPSCDKFARGRAGLCVLHSQMVQGRDVEMAGHGGISLPEGRVHGGSLMEMLRGGSGGPPETRDTRYVAGGGSWL